MISHHATKTALAKASPSLVLYKHGFAKLPAVVGSYYAGVSSFSVHTEQQTSTIPANMSIRHFSSLHQDTKRKGIITKTLKALDTSVVGQIKSELLHVDINGDGKIDAQELKKLLINHSNSFSDAEALEISEVFYAAKAGGSVSIDKFIEAIDHAVAFNDGNYEDKEQEQSESGYPMTVGKCAAEYMFAGKSHGLYTPEQLDVKLTHVEPDGIRDNLALGAVKGVRYVFDTATGWNNDNFTADKILQRVIYLETIAAVPGMVAAIIRHFKSLRAMERDGGLLQMFLEEANNERMHLLTFVGMKNPSTLFRAAVLAGQVGFGSAFLLAYMMSPKFCHRFVGYIEEEACLTYTKIIDAIEEAPDGSELAKWRTERAPNLALAYWKLGQNGTVLDLMYAVRADEAEHRDVNHLVSGMERGQINPFYDPQAKLDQMLRKYVKDIMKTA